MPMTREKRIQPLVWYTLGEYKVYFVQMGKWYAKVFPRKGIVKKTPLYTFEGETKLQVIKKLDDHCLETFGKVFRFKKAVQEEKIGPKVPKKKKCVCGGYPEEVKKNAQEVTDGLLKFFVDIIVSMNSIKKLNIACLVTSGLSLLGVILLIIMSL